MRIWNDPSFELSPNEEFRRRFEKPWICAHIFFETFTRSPNRTISDNTFRIWSLTSSGQLTNQIRPSIPVTQAIFLLSVSASHSKLAKWYTCYPRGYICCWSFVCNHATVACRWQQQDRASPVPFRDNRDRLEYPHRRFDFASCHPSSWKTCLFEMGDRSRSRVCSCLVLLIENQRRVYCSWVSPVRHGWSGSPKRIRS